MEILDDSSPEQSEDFEIRISNPTGGATIPFLASIQRVRIVANDGGEAGILGFTGGAVTVAENRTSVALAVSRRDGSTGAVSVDYATSAGSATSRADFEAASGTLTWPDGDAEDRTIRVNIANDSTRENDETFEVTLLNATAGASVGFRASATVTIRDDDSFAGSGGSGDGSGGGGCLIPGAALLLLWRRRFHVTRSRAQPDPLGDC